MVTHTTLHVKQNRILVFQDLPLAAVCKVCGIVYSDFVLLSNFLGGKSRHEAHVGEQLLTEAQEEILAKWVKIQGRRGIPMTYDLSRSVPMQFLVSKLGDHGRNGSVSAILI
jgi:hypothetical protein